MDVTHLVETLLRRGQTVAVAESLTGGLLAATLVTVPGVSRVFRGGLVVYATDLKATLAGVPADLLAARGPVDPDVAAALALGARDRCQADWGIGTTGVAGPDPQGGEPVGTVYVAVAGPSTDVIGSTMSRDMPRIQVRHLVLSGDRASVRAQAVQAALELLAEQFDR